MNRRRTLDRMPSRLDTASTTEDCRRGPGLLQWSAGAWFGVQLGSTLWMALGSALLFARPSLTGFAPLACFAAANTVGTLLWRARGRLAPYSAFQILLCVVGLSAGVALVFLTEGFEDATRYFRGLLLLPMSMIYLHYLERSARRDKSNGE